MGLILAAANSSHNVGLSWESSGCHLLYEINHYMWWGQLLSMLSSETPSVFISDDCLHVQARKMAQRGRW